MVRVHGRYSYKDLSRDKGSRIDLRSLSRVGKSDVGTNAKRVREFLKTVKGG
jgi:uncharacterized protein (DUF1499 family)